MTPSAVGSIVEVLSTAARGHPARDARFWSVPEERLPAAGSLPAELIREKDAWMAGTALDLAAREAKVTRDAHSRERVGLALGCALAGQLGMIEFANEVREQSPRFVSPIHFPQTVGNYVAGALARAFDIKGPNVTLSTGVASGLDAIIEAARLVQNGDADLVYAGGIEKLSDKLVTGLPPSNVPYSEGACLFVVERKEKADSRGVPALAEVITWRNQPASMPIPDAACDRIVSVATGHHEEAIGIEAWSGRCFGAAGAAAVAAAIGASLGLAVPLAPKELTTTESPVETHTFKLTPGAVGRISAVIAADANDAHRSVLEISVRTNVSKR